MKEYAISGSNGFIGRTLGERLQQFEVIGRNGTTPSSDVIFDLAAYGNYHDQKDPVETYKANVTRVVSMLDQANTEQRFILTSSSAVKLTYQTFYTASKMATERLAEAFVNERGLKICTVRPFSITGVGEQERHLIPKLIDSCLNGTEMPFVGNPVHDFLDVSDFVNALVVISEKGQFDGEMYEVGSGVQTSNEEVKEMVEEITGNKANIKRVKSLRSYDTKDWVANNLRICSLGWMQNKTLYQSISEQVEHARKNI